jgi:hypothetical protein
MTEPWWASGSLENVAESAVAELREDQWTFFEADVIPAMRGLLDSPKIAGTGSMKDHVRQRLRSSDRYRPSQLLFALSQDLDLDSESHIWAASALEFLLFARLIDDDIADQHDSRWGLPSMRVIFSDPGAHQIANMLRDLAYVSADQLDRRLRLLGRGARAATLSTVINYSLDVSAAMLEEISWSGEVASRQWYEDIARRKVSSGQLTIDLVELMLPEGLGAHGAGPTHAALKAALSDLDLAASIANDVTEANLLRGLTGPRFASGERRGPKTEIQLGRPTVFDVYLWSDEFVRHHTDIAPSDVHNLSTFAPDDLHRFLREVGAIDYAIDWKKSLEAGAFVEERIPAKWKARVLLEEAVETNEPGD